jgi:hypothetical protein
MQKNGAKINLTVIRIKAMTGISDCCKSSREGGYGVSRPQAHKRISSLSLQQKAWRKYVWTGIPRRYQGERYREVYACPYRIVRFALCRHMIRWYSEATFVLIGTEVLFFISYFSIKEGGSSNGCKVVYF